MFQGFREIGNAILFCLQLEGFLVSYCGQSLADVFVKLVANTTSASEVVKSARCVFKILLHRARYLSKTENLKSRYFELFFATYKSTFELSDT